MEHVENLRIFCLQNIVRLYMREKIAEYGLFILTALGTQKNALLKDTDANHFLTAYQRHNIYEECCYEGCRVEEVREYCY